MRPIKSLLLVDFENVHNVDLSLLDASFSAIIYVGATQHPPKAANNPAAQHRFARVDFQKIDGRGKNALDFHIAFQLGRTLETAPRTRCFVLSRDKGFDPLIRHVNKIGLKCSRLNSLSELPAPVAAKPRNPTPKPAQAAAAASTSADTPKLAQVPTEPPVVCARCLKASTIEHYGGQWCTNCGRFASEPDPKLLPSNQPGFRARSRYR